MSARYYIYIFFFFLIHGLYCGLPSLTTIYKNHQTHFSNWSNLFSPLFFFFKFIFWGKWKQEHIQESDKNKRLLWKKNKIFTSYLILYLSSLWLFCRKTQPNTVSRDIFEDQTIVLLVLAQREYHTAVVALQIATVSLMPTPKTVQMEPRLARICRWTRVHSSERDNFSKFLPGGGEWI